MLAEADVPYFDDGPVSLVGTASLEWCRRELGVDADPRRTRTNLVLETTQPFEEETWAGRSLRIGSVELSVDRRLERCRMVDLAQDGVATTTPMLKALGASRERLSGHAHRRVRPGAPEGRGRRHRALTPQPGRRSVEDRPRSVDDVPASVEDTPNGEISFVFLGIPLARVAAQDIELSYALPPGRAGSDRSKGSHRGASCGGGRVTKPLEPERTIDRSEASPVPITPKGPCDSYSRGPFTYFGV